ncbi:hypothetical protein BJ508DRAFT_371969 [Ascobolus immersus RN42]|uniref:Uncharacterized protein n=1 Tax=Ascobolus immersus RN42 TaxID=1160509 RepID=A0A3N4IPJ9_ASCIM|nr:hypothetical protein BJ508DRAFT_371969 [Ascobolus immersus RN42]
MKEVWKPFRRLFGSAVFVRGSEGVVVVALVRIGEFDCCLTLVRGKGKNGKDEGSGRVDKGLVEARPPREEDWGDASDASRGLPCRSPRCLNDKGQTSIKKDLDGGVGELDQVEGREGG